MVRVTKVSIFITNCFHQHLICVKDGDGCQGNQLSDWRVETNSPTPTSREEGLEVEPMANSQWFYPLCLCNEATINTHKVRFRRVSRLVDTWRC